MRTNFFSHSSERPPARRTGSVAVWTLLIAALVLLTLAAGLRADAQELRAHASRTQNFVASGNLKSLSIENVNGNVEILSGPSFKAEADVTVYADTESLAKKRLEDVKAHFDNDNGDLSLYTEEPGVTVRRSGRGWNVHSHRDDDDGWRTEVRYRITMPPGIAANVSTVNGAVSVSDLAAPVNLSTVNGKIDVAGARRETKLNTVNGAIRATFAELQKSVNVDVRTVNGSITITLPAKAGFRFEGHTMSGEILSSFALPTTADDDETGRARDESKGARDKIRAERDKVRSEIREKQRKHPKSDDSDDGVIDLSELNEALADLNREMVEMSRELSRTITVHLNRAYEGTVGGGGASVRCSNLNGRILVLAEGTTEAQAKKLTSGRGPLVVMSPSKPRAPRAALTPLPPVPPAPAPFAPIPPMAANPWERSISEGDREGDLVLDYAPSDVTAGQIGGRVKISTQSGQIRVKGAGKGAELSSAGGDIRIESVTGDLKATTSGGDIRAGAVTGDARLETAGGDVVVRSGGGSIAARTGGGDITLKKVRGPVVARTSGGTISCEITSAAAAGGELATSGGDVTITLPANYRADVDVRVSGVDPDTDAVISQFPEITVSHRPGSISGEGKLNGGGPRLTIRSNSGTVTIRKGPAA